MHVGRKSRYLWPITSAAGFIFIGAAAHAFEYSLRADYQAEYTDNARREAEDESSDVVHRVGVLAAANHAGPRTQLDMSYRAHRRMYQDDSFKDDTVLEGFIQGTWDAVPARLSLFASNTRRENLIRIEDQATPDNLQVSSRSSVGATYRADLLSNHYGLLTYTYTDVHSEETENDSGRHTGQAVYAIPLSDITTLSLVGTVAQVDFDDPLAPDYDSTTGTINLDRIYPQSTLNVSAGYTRIDRELARSAVDGYVGSLRWNRTFAESTFALALSRDFKDNSLDNWDGRFRIADDVIIGPTELNEVYSQNTAMVSFMTPLGVNRLLLVGVAAQQDYESDVAGDTMRIGGQVRLSRPLRPSIDGYVSVAYTHFDFEDVDRKDDAYSAGAGLTWNATPRLTLSARAGYFVRKDESPSALDSEEVSEWSASIGATYFLFGTATR